MEKTLKICIAGFGNVGRELCRLLTMKQEEIESQYGYRISVTGISTKTKGALVDTNGLNISEVFKMYEILNCFDENHPAYLKGDTLHMIEKSGADVFIEMSTLSIDDGEPATGYMERAFDHNMHVISTNKGPIAWNYKKLLEKSQNSGKLILFETVVMDGTPVFNLVKNTLHGNKILGIRGILNGTSNFVLCQLEKGISYNEAIKTAQKIGLAEADPSMDMDGWDGAAKICAMANMLMNAHTNPKMVSVESISNTSLEDIVEAKNAGYRIKYICHRYLLY